MFPFLYRSRGVEIHTYPVAILLAFFLTLVVVRALSPKENLPGKRMVDLAFLVFILGMIGARLLFVLTQVEYFSRFTGRMLSFFSGGYVFYGGFIFGVIAVFYLTKKWKLPTFRVLDVFAIALCLGHAVGRVGCFGAGCCYGIPTKSFLGMTFTSPLVAAALRPYPLHPVQLYESIGLFVLFLVLLKLRKAKAYDGQIAIIYVAIYSVFRFFLEFLRGDLIRGVYAFGISTSQIISLLIFGILAATLIYKKKSLVK